MLQDLANSMTSKFIPDFATQGLVDHDYTVLAMRRYAESSRHYWTKIIRKVKSQHTALIEPIIHFRQTQLKSYKDSRRNFDNAQTKYDNALSRYLGFAKNKEPSALREDAFQLAETRNEYVKARFALCSSILTTQSKVDNCLVKTFSETWILSPKEFVAADPASQRISIEMLRLKSWAKTMQKCANPLAKEMEKAALEMEQNVISHSEPSRDLNSYTVQASTISHFVPVASEKTTGLDQKNGWLFVKSTSNKGVRQVWVRRWVFVKNGMFGWLNISPNKTFVQECDKIGVLLCHVTPVPSEDRRFVFEIKTKDNVLFMQAETLEDLRSWLQVFEDAKRLAIEGDKRSTISHAFQRFPPMISEFASTAGTSIDVELTHDGSNIDDDSSGDNITLGKSISLFKGPDDSFETSFLNQDEPLSTSNQTTTTARSNSLGPFGAALAPSPLLNTPMPTSMSHEAVLSTTLVQNSDIPTAVTANYWGSVNWAAYQRSLNGNPTPHTLSASSSTMSLAQINNEKYPSYYPPVLRSQDAQLRSIYEGIPSDDLNSRVVLVFRCIYKPNPKQQLPARVYMTPKAVYIYSNFLGFVSSVMFPLSLLISVEGKTGLHQDTLFLISNTKTAACYSYIDSGRILQKRIQFLIDNLKSENPLKLKDIIKKLQSIGSEQNEEDLVEEKEEADLDLLTSPIREMIADETRSANDKRYLNLYMASYLNDSQGRVKLDTNITNPSEEGAKPAEVLEKPKQEPLPDYSKLMAQLSKELVFDIPAKAMFHLMFGEKSPVFKYTENGTIIRSNIETTPWRLVHTHMVEREISFNTSDSNTKTLFTDSDDRITYLQRIERMDNNWCYVVFQRHAVVKLPQGDSFYTTHRFVITKLTKSSCTLSIWSNIEWIKSSIFKNVTEPMIMNKLTLDANAVLRECVVAREKLGPSGSTNTAIRMFGKLGTSLSAITKSLSAAKSLDLADQREKEHEEFIARQAMIVSNKSLVSKIWEITLSVSISIVEEIVILIRHILKHSWIFLTTNKGLVLLTIVLGVINIGLAGISTKSYWMERHAEQVATKYGISLETPLYMQRSILLTDVDNLIHTGINYSAEVTNSVNVTNDTIAPALCYNKFKDLTLMPTGPEDYPYDPLSNTESESSSSNAIRNRIFELRSQIGVQRNWLMVELRTINKVETDLIMAEWRSWLYDEVARCGKVRQPSSSGSANDTSEIIVPNDRWDALVEYCKSCRLELDSGIELDHVV